LPMGCTVLQKQFVQIFRLLTSWCLLWRRHLLKHHIEKKPLKQ
jgi:hypothetical protein